MAKLRTQEGKRMARNMNILFGVYLHGYFHAQKNNLTYVLENYRRELMVLVQAFRTLELLEDGQFDSLISLFHNAEGF